VTVTAVALLATQLLLALTPWRGAQLPSAAPIAAHYRLTIRGAPHARARLEGRTSARGWIVSFCTRKLCTPFGCEAMLSSRGTETLEVQGVRIDARSPRSVRLTVAAANVSVWARAALPR